MKRVHKVSLCAAAFCFISLPLLQAAPITGDTVTSSLTVQGDSDIEGNVTTIGSWTGDTAHFGLQISYTDSATSASSIIFTAGRETNLWQWEQNAFGTATKQMTLDGTAKLSLFNASGDAVIVLNPAGSSPGITINGQPVATLDQVVLPDSAASFSSLTVAGGTLSGGFMAAGGGASASGGGSVALGHSASANANYSMALGYSTQANGLGSTTLGYVAMADEAFSTALGANTSALSNYSTALGAYTTAVGYKSLALGAYSTAYGDYSTALGKGAYAYGESSVALGPDTRANGYGEFVVGQWNLPQQNPASLWVSTENLFVVGNGRGENYRSNALVIQKNGDMNVNGKTFLYGPGYNPTNLEAGRIALTPAINGGSITINGEQVLTTVGGANPYLTATTANSTFLTQAAAAAAYVPLVTGGLSIQPNGNVGIGTTAPGAKLSFGSGVNAQTMLLYEGGTSRYGFGIQPGEMRQFFDEYGHFSIGTISQADGSTFSEKLRVDGPTGNIGIGTSAPQAKLDIVSTSAGLQTTALRLSNESNAMNTATALQFYTDNAGVVGSEIVGARDNATDHSLRFKVNSAEVLRMNANGRVGIGSANPSATLEVSTAAGPNPLKVVSAGHSVILTQSTSPSFRNGISTLDSSGTITGSFQYGGPSADGFVNQVTVSSRVSSVPLVFYQGGMSSANQRMNMDAGGNILLTPGASGAVSIGTGVTSAMSDQVVVGKYNDTRTSDNGTNHTEGVFVVANGADASNRKNAMRVVEQNGQTLVLIQKAGDLSMGEFESGPRP